MEGWRDGKMERWRDGGMEAWRDGSIEAWRGIGMERWRGEEHGCWHWILLTVILKRLYCYCVFVQGISFFFRDFMVLRSAGLLQ